VRGHKEESEVKWKADRSWWAITLDCGVAMRSFGVYARGILDDTTSWKMRGNKKEIFLPMIAGSMMRPSG
jgi:hypothetical protein